MVDFKKAADQLINGRNAALKYPICQQENCIKSAQKKALELCYQADCEYAHEAGYWCQSHPGEVPHRIVRYKFKDCEEARMLFYINEPFV